MKNLLTKIKSLDKSMIIRIGLQICAIANEIVALIGMTSYASNPVYQYLSAGVLIILSCLNAWKNNDFTYFAQLSGKILAGLKDGTITDEELKEIIKTAEENKEINQK